MTSNVIPFRPVPGLGCGTANHRVHDCDRGPNAFDPGDRVVWDADTVDAKDDASDEFVTLPVRVGAHYGEPTIELGRYSLALDDAVKLATLLRVFTSKFTPVPVVAEEQPW